MQAARIAQEKDELKAAEKMAERPWNGDADYGAQGQEDQTDEHMRMIKRRNYVRVRVVVVVVVVCVWVGGWVGVCVGGWVNVCESVCV